MKVIIISLREWGDNLVNRTDHAKKNIISGIINKLIAMLMPFIIRTAMIEVLGVEYLGLNSLFTSILHVLNLAELGFSQAVIYNLYKPMAEGNKPYIYALLNMYKKVYRIVGTIMMIVGLALIPFLPKLIKNGSAPEDINLYMLYLIYLFNTVISYWLFAYMNCILYADQKNNVINNINSAVQIFLNCSQLIVLIILKNYYAYLILMPICTVINNLWIAYATKKRYPDLRCEGALDKQTIKSMKKNIVGLGIQKLCATTRNSLDSIFVSAFLGLTMTAVYNNYYMILSSLTALVYIIANSICSSVGNSIATESMEKNYQDMMRFNFLYMWISGWTTVCLFCLYQPFMRLWMGGKGDDYVLPIIPVILFCLYYYVLRMGDIRSVYNESAGLFWETKVRAIAESIGNILLNYILVKLFGLTGIIAATLISLFLFNFIWSSQITFRYYFKGIKISSYFIAHCKYFFVTLIVCGITFLLTNVLISGESIIQLILRGVICAVFPNLLMLIFYYRTKDYGEAIVWLCKKSPRLGFLSFLIPKNYKKGVKCQ